MYGPDQRQNRVKSQTQTHGFENTAYDVKVIHRPGTQLKHADFFSRYHEGLQPGGSFRYAIEA